MRELRGFGGGITQGPPSSSMLLSPKQPIRWQFCRQRKWGASDGGGEEEEQRVREERGEDFSRAICGGDGVCARRVCGCCWLHEEDGEDKDGEEHGEI